MKRILTLLLMALLLAVPVLADELVEVRVTGRGLTEDAALKDAFRSAARQVFGTFVVAETLTENAQLVQDQILALTKGNIDHFDLLSKSVVEGVTIVDLKAYLSKGEIRQMVAHLGLSDWDAQLSGLSALGHLQEKHLKEVAALKALFGNSKRFVQQAYNFSLTGVEITDVGADYLAGNLVVRVTRNDLFFDQYRQLLETIAVQEGNVVPEGLVTSPAEALPGFTMFGDLRYPTQKWDPQVEVGLHRLKQDRGYYELSLVDAYHVHGSLAPYLPTRMLAVNLHVGDQTGWVGVLRNAVVIGKNPGKKPDFSGFYASGFVNNRDGKLASGYEPTIKSGAVYADTKDETEVVTKNSFEFKMPFRVASPEALRRLVEQPVTFSVEPGPVVDLTMKRFVQDFTYFVAEK